MGRALRLLFLFCILWEAQLLLSEDAPLQILPEPISLVNLTAEPSSFVNGSVNVISGDYIETAQSACISGPDPYILGHAYISSSLERGNISHGWTFHHYHLLRVFQPRAINYTSKGMELVPKFMDGAGPRDRARRAPDSYTPPPAPETNPQKLKNPYTHLYLYETSGGKILFKGDGKAKHFRPVLKGTGYTNTGAGEISGKSSIRNMRVVWDSDKDEWHVTSGDGTKRIYARRFRNKRNRKPGHYNFYFRDYHIIEEKKPSGNVVYYSYDDEKHIKSIKTVSDTTYTSNWVEFRYPDKLHTEVETSDGHIYTYKFKKIDCLDKKERYVVVKITRPGEAPKLFDYTGESKNHNPRVEKASFENGAFLETKYYREDAVDDKDRGKFLRHKVKLQNAPVGPSGESVTTHTYFYHRDDDGIARTTVVDALGNKSRYFYDQEKRLTRIEREEKDVIVMAENFIFAGKNEEDEGNLLSRILFDEKNRPVFARSYKYDSSGNVVKETVFGNFSGNSDGEIKLDKNGFPLESSTCEQKITRCSYSDDGFNLKLSVQDPDQNYTFFEYKEGTNLLTARFTCDGKSIKKREFFSYDSKANLVTEIVDDGTSRDREELREVTERHIKRYTPRLKTPHFGAPETICAYFLDLKSGKEKLISRTVNSFNKEGLVSLKKSYDADGKLYTHSEYAYDKAGRVIYSKDILGREESFTYDAFGRLSSKKGPRHDVETNYCYDIAGRLVKEEERHESGLILVNCSRYDVLGRKIATIDPQGNETKMEYDSFNRVIKVTSPKFENAEGEVTESVRCYRYSHLSQKMVEVDELGYETKRTFSASGKLLLETLPDGRVTQYFYDILDRLIKEISPNGLESLHCYDYAGRITKTVQSHGKKEISVKKAVYNTFHLLQQISPTEETLFFTYDAQGRKSSDRHQSKTRPEARITTYCYDGLGRVIQERKMHDEDQYVAKEYTYDELSRVLSEALKDHKGELFTYKSMRYDAEGNVIEKTENIQGKNATTKTFYYPHGIASKIVDALGNVTLFEIDYFHKNALKQYVVKKTSVDAHGVKSVEILNAKGSPVDNYRLDPYGKRISRKKSFYDVASNLVRIEEMAISLDAPRLITTKLQYGPQKRLETIIEAYGTPEQKETRYFYNEFGQKNFSIHADGTKVYYSYDEKGRLNGTLDIGKTFFYQYLYDASDRIISVKNALTDACTKRSYNGFGDLESETLENGITLQYDYDGLGRIADITLPDQSQISYRYSQALLANVLRCKSDGRVAYQYTITERDLSGHILAARLPGNGGIERFSYDLLGRVSAHEHPLFTETVPENGYDAVSNLKKITVEGPLGKKSERYTYDFLSQLTSENGTESHKYTYDSLFNRLQKDDEVYEVNALHAVTQAGDATYRYDKNGNRVTKNKENEHVEYGYDGLNRLISVEMADKRIEYSYDAFHRRIKKKVLAKEGTKKSVVKEERFLYVQDNEIGSMDQGGTIHELRLLGEGVGAEIGATVAIEHNQENFSENFAESFAVLHDYRGNIAMLLNQATGSLESYYEYTAFGEERCYNKQLEKTADTNSPWRFSGKRVDAETGFLFFGRRYYDPSLGKWLTQDPLGLKAGPNLYAYVLNNPLTHIDLYGLLEEERTAGAAAGNSASTANRGGNIFEKICRSVRDAVLGAADSIVHNFTPFDCVKEKFCNTVRSWMGKPPRDYRGSVAVKIKHGGTASQVGKSSVVFGNGMVTTYADAQANINTVLESFQGNTQNLEFELNYNASHGFLMDLSEVVLNSLGFNTHAVEAQAEGWSKACADSNVVFSALHSQGGLIGYSALSKMQPSEKQKLHIVTFGSAQVIYQSDGVASAVNYISRWDLVPLLGSPIRYLRAAVFGHPDVQFVGSWFSIPFSQHAFQSKDYQNAARKYFAEIKH